MKKMRLICAVAMMMWVLAGCRNSTDQTELENASDSVEKTQMQSAEAEKPEQKEETKENLPQNEKEEEPVFELTENGKSFLEGMCMVLPDFSDEADMDEAFWNNFIFCGYTSSDGETVTVYREDIGFDETERKVEAEEVSKYAKLVLGKELPDIKPAFDDMTEGQTALYYDDGYYYIGCSDFACYMYVYDNCEVQEENGDTYALVTYHIYEDYEDASESAGTVTMRICPADNENGFVITSKTTAIK